MAPRLTDLLGSKIRRIVIGKQDKNPTHLPHSVGTRSWKGWEEIATSIGAQRLFCTSVRRIFPSVLKFAQHFLSVKKPITARRTCFSIRRRDGAHCTTLNNIKGTLVCSDIAVFPEINNRYLRQKFTKKKRVIDFVNNTGYRVRQYGL